MISRVQCCTSVQATERIFNASNTTSACVCLYLQLASSCILWPFSPLSSALSRIIISASCYSLWSDIYSDYKYSDDCSSSFVKNNQWSFASPTLISSYCSSTRHWDEVMFIPKKQSQVYKFQSRLQVHPGKKWTISIPTSYSSLIFPTVQQ